MTSQTITPDFVIELNEDYSISNHGIHKRVCSYYRKTPSNITNAQTGGFIRGGSIFPKNCRKYFTSSALRYLQKYNMEPSHILSSISNSYNPEYYNSSRTDDLNDYMLQRGGRSRASKNKGTNQVIFEENYSGDKEDKRLVYLISFGGITVVVKFMRATELALKEKGIYQYFNKHTKDKIVDQQILRTYETQTYPNEHLDEEIPYLVIPCMLNKKKYNLKLSNEVVPMNDKGQIFLTREGNFQDNNQDMFQDNNVGTYNHIKRQFKQCTYIVVEVRPTFFIFKDYVKGEASPDIIKRLIFKTSNMLKYLNNMYGFNHWDLHYHNLMIYVSPNEVNGKSIPNEDREIDVCFFDFDLSAAGKYKNIDAYYERLLKYIRSPRHNLLKSYKNMLRVPNIQEEPSASSYEKELFKNFEDFLENEGYSDYDIEVLNLESSKAKYKTKQKLEIYFKYMGRIHDLIRLMNIGRLDLNITIDDLQQKITKSTVKDESKTNKECIIIYKLMKYISLSDHKKMAYGTLLFTDYLLYLRNIR